MIQRNYIRKKIMTEQFLYHKFFNPREVNCIKALFNSLGFYISHPLFYTSFMTEIETLKELYAAINRNDIPAVLNLFDPQIVRIEFEGSPSGGTYRGLGEIKAHFDQARGTWAEGSCEPEKFVTAGDKTIVFVHVHVRLKDKTEWIDGRVADAFTFKNSKVIEMRSFFENAEALKWANGQ